jgi:hypothetical protein
MPSFVERVETASGETTYVNGVARLTVSTTGVALAGTVTGAGGAFSLVETKTLSAASGTQTFSGLSGDTDKQYILEGDITVSSGSLIEVYPNGNTGNVMTTAYITNSSGVTSPAGGSTTKLQMPAGSSVSSGERLQFTIRILADSRGGTFAALFSTNCINDATNGGGAIRQQLLSSAFTPKTAITSIGVGSTAGTMTGRLSLFKITP